MSHPNQPYSVECSITIAPPGDDFLSTVAEPVGLLYSAEINPTAHNISTKLALSGGGAHADILAFLYRKQLIDDAPSDDLSFLPIRDSDGNMRPYSIRSWQDKQPQYRDFSAFGMCIKETVPQNETLATAADLGTRALILATRDFYMLRDGSSVIWTPEDLQSVPENHIYT